MGQICKKKKITWLLWLEHVFKMCEHLCYQVRTLAREIYNQYFKAAEATPRGIMYKMKVMVQQLEAACAKQITQVKVGTLQLPNTSFC